MLHSPAFLSACIASGRDCALLHSLNKPCAWLNKRMAYSAMRLLSPCLLLAFGNPSSQPIGARLLDTAA